MLSMRATDRGWWELETEAAPRDDYGFALDGGEPLPDPRSRWQPHGVHGLSRLVDPSSFVWTDAGWQGLELGRAVLYELHVGTFTPEGTFDGVIGRLDSLVSLGVDAIELMPVAEASGDRGWGYDGVDLWAPRQAYGGPAGLARLVDACHARGLGVILDVVYNHLGPEGNYLGRFGPYQSGRHRTPWGEALNFDGPQSRPVRDFVVENAAMWLRDYHFDGLRLDAVHAIIDDSPVHIVQELTQRVHGLGGPPRLVVAEKPKLDLELLGWGVDAQWEDDFHHVLHVLLTGERQAYYAPYGRVGDLAEALLRPGRLGIAPERLLAYAQNHDQVGNRATGTRLSQLVDVGRLQLAATLTLLSPFIPMIFMGEEWGASTPFLFFSDHRDPQVARATSEGRMHEFQDFGWRPEEVPDPQLRSSFEASKLDWSEPEREPHRSLLELHRSLIIRRRRLAGRGLEVAFDEAERTLTMSRGGVQVDCDFQSGSVSVKSLSEGMN
ncbi:MAG: malto-oligosyltrehalose trehalohydrolase [Candidatus Dormibacteraeota bacterium]|nr:malto-oligosyltrehalose trehalohydrolase [Candidatus Dormibacteraeota bacterium]